MRRRTYLALLGGVLSAGCTASGESQPTSNRGSHNGDRHHSPTMSPSERKDTFDPESTFKTVEIADETQPYEVVVWNADDAAREITVQIHKDRPESDTTTVLDTTYEIPTDQALEIQLVEPATYTIDVTVPATDSQTDIRIPQTRFDCNGVTHRVAVRSDGSIDVSTISTMVACTTETATDT